MATKKVLVKINVEQKGVAIDKTTEEVKKLTEVEKERLRIKRETEKTDAKLEVVNEKGTKTLERRKKTLKDVNDLSKTWTGIMKESVAQIGKTNDELKNLNADYALWEKQSAAAAKQQEKLNKELEDEQIKLFKTQVKELTKEETLLEKATKKLAFAQSDEGKKLAIVTEQTKRANHALKQYAKEQVGAASATETTNNKLNEMKTTTGLSSAIVTEFGRTVSDAPYGIQGMGNNLAQLGSLFGTFAQNVKKSNRTMGDGFKELFGQMKGIIGIMTAFQIVIALVQTEWFQKWIGGLFDVNSSLKEFSSLMKDASDIAGKSMGNFKTYIATLKDTSSSLEEQEAAIKKLNKEYPDFNTNLFTNAENQKEQNKAVKEYNKLLLVRARSEAAMNKIRESESKIIDLKLQNELKTKPIKKQIKDIEELGYRSVLTTNQIIQATKDGYVTEEQISQQAIRLRQNKVNQIEKSSKKEIKSLEELQQEYLKLVNLEDDDKATTGGGAGSRRVKQFKEGLLSFATEQEKANQDFKNTQERNNIEILKQEGEFSKKSIQIKRDEFIDKEKIRLKDYIAQQNINKQRKGISASEVKEIEKAIKLAEEKSDKTIKSETAEAQVVIDTIEQVTQARIKNREKLDELNQQKRDDKVEEGLASTLVSIMSEGMAKVNAEAELDQLRYDNKVAAADAELLILTTTETRRRQIETEKQLWEQEKRETDLQNEINVINERKRVQEEYIGFVGQTAGVLQAIGDKNKEWQKVQLALEKGAAIASVVVNANRAILAREASYRAIPSLDPKASVFGIPKPNSAKLIDKGLKTKDIAKIKVGAGLSIAGITAAGISQASAINNSGGGDSSAGGGGNTTVQAPDFNIIGSTGVNQLAEAIGSTEKQDIRAYVVSTDITSKQALTRNIRESAEI